MPVKPGVRRSLIEIQAEYDRGDKASLEMVMRAWKGIKELPADDPRSFFIIGGFHGEPFRDQGVTNPAWWGGYCQHGTVLFPTWHRAYLHALETALQSIPGCREVMLPFWDETSPDSLSGGLPGALTWETFELDGQVIPNPLRSFVLPVEIVDAVPADNSIYSKPAGYETVRYPLSGLVGTPSDRAATAAHNARFADYDKNVELLNGNVTTWLTAQPVVGGQPIGGFVQQKFVRSMDAPNYTLFSNTTSTKAYNAAHAGGQPVVSLESPHNSIHLAIGGFDVPGAHLSPIAGANGDMGENNTAALDPVFYFHHCFIDYAFWTWQRRHDSTESLEIDPDDPGTHYSLPGNPPPAGSQPGDHLDVNSPLNPFKARSGSPMTSADVANIAQLGYSYGPGSLDRYATTQLRAMAEGDAAAEATRSVHVEGLDRSKLRGSFVISAFAEVDGEMQAVGHEAVLSRWQVEGCANCMSHLDAGADFALPANARATAEGTADAVEVRVTSRDDQLQLRDAGLLADVAPPEPPAFRVEVR
ncbi:MAG TPA: tyrosinase family protein [Thermoleophilaceae bacterium]